MKNGKMTRTQFMTVAFVALFTPIVRLVPSRMASIGGSAGWIAPIVAIPAVMLLLWLFIRFYSYNDPGEGLGRLFTKAMGQRAGGAALVLYGLWLLAYGGFILRSSSERFLSGVFENGNLTFFVITMMVIVTLAARKSLRILARSAQIFLIIMIIILGFMFAFAIPDIKTENLMPVSILDAGSLGLSVLALINSLSPWVYMTFLSGETEQNAGRFKKSAGCMLASLALAFLIVLGTIGNFGAELTARLQNPFFTMVRDVKIFDLLERVETLVVLLWVATDFVFLTALLMSASEALRAAFAAGSRVGFVIPGAAAMLAVAFLIAPDAFALSRISMTYVPAVNMGFIFVGLPIVYAVGKIRRKFAKRY